MTLALNLNGETWSEKVSRFCNVFHWLNTGSQNRQHSIYSMKMRLAKNFEFNNLKIYKYLIEIRLFNSIQQNTDTSTKNKELKKTVSHWKPKIYVTILTDHFAVSNEDIPPEMGRLLRWVKSAMFLQCLICMHHRY